MKKFYVIEYNTPASGHYLYLDDVLENTKTRAPEYYTTTDQPAKALHWPTKDEAEKFLAGLPFKDDFHVQAIILGIVAP